MDVAIGFHLEHVKGWRVRYKSGRNYRQLLGPTNPPAGWDYELAGTGDGSAVAAAILGGNPIRLHDPKMT